MQGEAALLRESLGVFGGRVAVVPDAEPEVKAIDLVAEFDENVPNCQRVLAAGDSYQDPFALREHGELLDGLRCLVSAEPQEVLLAEVRVMPADVDHGRAATYPALHTSFPPLPPLITDRISTRVEPASILSPGTSSPSSITRCDSRFNPSLCNRTPTSTGPSTSTSRVGLRSMTITWLSRCDE